MPSLEKIAFAYGFPYYRISDNEDLSETVKEVMEREGAAICEICGDIDFDEIPKCISSVGIDGKITSAVLENPFPFLHEEELRDIYRQI